MFCKGCLRAFLRQGALLSHQKQVANCCWILEECQAQAPGAKRDFTNFETLDEDPLIEAEPDDFFTLMEDLEPGPQTPCAEGSLPDDTMPAAHRRASVEDMVEEAPAYIDSFPGAGRIYGEDTEAYHKYLEHSQHKENVYHPFANELEWDIAKWAKDTQQGETALTKLLTVPGVVSRLGLMYPNARGLNQIIDHELPERPPWRKLPIQITGTSETFYLYHRDVMECLRSLWSNPALCTNRMYTPERQYSDAQRWEQLRNKMNTGDWWWKMQVKLPDGATVVPIIFSSDKTQLSVFSGDHTAYPIYMTIGNIPKAIRCKPSSGAQVLIGYLPTVDLEGSNLSANAACVACMRLFHYAMTHIVQPLIDPGKEGVLLTGGDGKARKCFPILACYVADYPEQCLVACTRYGDTDPKSDTRRPQFGVNRKGILHDPVKALRLLREATSIATVTVANEFLKKYGLTDVPEPFWACLPHADIHGALTPDILHQLYQGLVKHLIGWLEKIVGPTELDACIQHLPPACALHHFKDGITHLTRMCKQILGCIIGVVPVDVVKATPALLDFIYLAQYENHSPETLKFLQHALNEFHHHKAIFLRVGAHLADNMNFPKLQSLQHFVHSINLFGMTDNYNTEASEHLHIDYAKDAFAATNKKEEYLKQMALWLERQEKTEPSHLNATQTPSYIHCEKPKPELYKTITHSSICAAEINFPRPSVDVWWQLKFSNDNLRLSSAKQTEDIVHAEPVQTTRAQKTHNAWFDTALVQHSDGHHTGIRGLRVCQVRVIFKLSGSFIKESLQDSHLPLLHADIPVAALGPLAYVEWFTTPELRSKHTESGMFQVSQSIGLDHRRETSIIKLESFQRGCHLYPIFGNGRCNRAWTSHNVLERCLDFYVNPYVDNDSYQTIW
ncbi:hypothetical protein K439DRAFT_1614939 [Ramaria rubella]|nr:hypothetical protein K439DRAFT_1614939 [Ramaria rubella]